MNPIKRALSKSAGLGPPFSRMATPLAVLSTTILTLFALVPLNVFAQTCEQLFMPTAFQPKLETSSILSDPIIRRVMELELVPDFKPLVDFVPRVVSAEKRAGIETQANRIGATKGEKAKLRYLLEHLYDGTHELLPVESEIVKPKMTLSLRSPHKGTFDTIEATWTKLVRQTPRTTTSTLIPVPNPVLIPGARFQEAYYWDSYFAMHALVKTGRSELVRGQIDNFLFMIKNYGLVPNGNRDYYLSRSQPPLLSRMVRTYLELTARRGLSPADRAWLQNEVLPLVRRDYEQFWMNPQTRLDARTGLNHHYDSQNVPRPERHAADREDQLGATYRDVRAEAESGKDFTIAFEGEATQYAGVLLNTVLFGVERDLAYFSKMVGKTDDARKFNAAARKRAQTMNHLMRDPATGLYFDYHLGKQKQSPVLTADTFAPLYFRMVAKEATPKLIAAALPRLEARGGIMSSENNSGKQWDAPYGWAPHMMFAIDGLRHYGFTPDAKRIAANWVATVDRVHARIGKILEKYDMSRAESPVETGDKYVTQEGFLWTNGVYVWAVTDVLGSRPKPIPKN